MDREKVIKAFCEDVVAVKNLNGFSINITISESLYFDVIALLKEQEAEIAFLKAMQLQVVHNMSDEDIGNAVRNVLRL